MNSSTITITSASNAYCGINGHVRVWAGSAEAAPHACHCGAVRYVKHQCQCGDIHETEVSSDPITSVLRREWATPAEDEAWKHL